MITRPDDEIILLPPDISELKRNNIPFDQATESYKKALDLKLKNLKKVDKEKIEKLEPYIEKMKVDIDHSNLFNPPIDCIWDWYMTAKSINTVIDWYTNYACDHSDSEIPQITRRGVFIAYLKDCITERIETAIKNGVRVPNGLNYSLVEFLIQLGSKMTMLGLTNIPPEAIGSQDESLAWTQKFFAEPAEGDKGYLFYLKMMRALAQDFIHKDEKGCWAFVNQTFIQDLQSISVVEISKIESDMKQMKLSVEEQKKLTSLACKEFAKRLFTNPVGPYLFLIDSGAWVNLNTAVPCHNQFDNIKKC